MVTAVERVLHFDSWAFDDPTGGSLGEITQAFDKQARDVVNQPGSFSFRINRNSSEFASMCATDTLVRVRVEEGGPFAYDDEGYYAVYIIEGGSDTIVSAGEQGGEIVELHGRSAEVLLERAIIDFEAHYPDDIVNHPYDKTALRDGQWHFSEDIPTAFTNAGSPGSVMRILLRNAGAMTPEPIPEVTHDFNINDDSNGDPWDDADGQFDFPVGMDLLTVLERLVDGGLHYRFRPDLTLRAWDNAQGTDLVGLVTIAKGVNVRESGQREIHASTSKSRVLVRGTTKNGTLKYRWQSSVDIEDAVGVRQGFLDYPHSPTNARLDNAGTVYLNERAIIHDGPPTVGIVDTSGATAYVDYVKGDTVGIDLPDIVETGVIHAVTLMDNDAGNVDVVLEFFGPEWQGNPAPPEAQNGDTSTGYASIGSGTQPVTLDPIDISETQVAIVSWVDGDATITEVTGTLVIQEGNGIAYVTATEAGTFTVEVATADTSAAYWVIVLPLGQVAFVESS